VFNTERGTTKRCINGKKNDFFWGVFERHTKNTHLEMSNTNAVGERGGGEKKAKNMDVETLIIHAL
jgi:hypothetical protein